LKEVYSGIMTRMTKNRARAVPDTDAVDLSALKSREKKEDDLISDP